jgi:hypothetical protein
MPVSGAAAQETRGSILGTVKDQSGGVLAGMVVVVTNEETNVAAEVVTNERGYFEVPYLVPVTYRLSIRLKGSGRSNPKRSTRSIAPCRPRRNGAGTFRIC